MSLYQKGLRYYLRLDRNGQPVLGSLVARRRKPSGRFIDLTPYINFCCNAEFGAGDITTLDAPANLAADPAGPGELNITWDPVDNATSYTVFIDGIEVHSGGSTGFLATGLVDGQIYSIDVVATRGAIESTPANTNGTPNGPGTTTTTTSTSTTTTSTSTTSTTSTTTAAPIPVQWMSQVGDPHPDLSTNVDSFVYTGSGTMASVSDPIEIDVHDATAYPDNNFIVVKVPATVTDKTVWADDPVNAPFNNGAIPDSNMRAMVSFGGFDYYYSRVGMIFDHTVSSRVTFS